MSDLFLALGKLFSDAFPVQWSPEIERLKQKLRQSPTWATTGTSWYRKRF